MRVDQVVPGNMSTFFDFTIPAGVLLALLHPFFYTFVLAGVYAFISKVGYTRASEMIYGAFQFVFGRRAHHEFMKNWKELKQAKLEVSKVSAQDEFAKWAKLQRKVDSLQSTFDSKYSSRQKTLLAVQFIGSVVLRIISYVTIVAFLYIHSSVSVMSLDLIMSELNAIPFGKYLAAFPSASAGEMSVAVWAVLCNIAFKEAFNALIA